jgi:hypothetical protein
MRLSIVLATCLAAVVPAIALSQEPAASSAANTPNLDVTAVPSSGPAVGYAVQGQKPKLSMFTLNNVAFGGLGVAGAAIAGVAADAIANTGAATQVTADDLDDPAQKLGSALAEAYAAKKGGHSASAPFMLQKGGPAPDMSGAAYVIYVETVNWGAYYLPLNWTHFHVQYFVKFHIVETASGKNVAKASCRKFARNAGSPPSFQELHADKGAVLKSLLASASDDCLQEFKTKI